MKKLLALALVVFGLAACQTEPEGLDVNVGGAVDTTITVSLPDTETRANSALGAFDNVVGSDKYTIRYIFQVFYNGTESQAARQVIYSDNKVVCFPVRLVSGRHYNFVVWADVVTQEGKTLNQLGVYDASADLHYNTADLKSIKLNGEWNAMDETRDAFTGHFDTAVDGDKTPYNGAKSINVLLTRPFAKLRVITTDMEQLNDLGIAPYKATVEYTVDHYNAFNAFAGKVIGDSKNRDIKHEDFEIKDYTDNVDDKSKVLFTDYFFATDEEEVVNFTLTVYEQNNTIIGETISFNTPIPARRNYLTTITGDILTDGNNIKVEVENNGNFKGEIEEKIVEVGNATDLKEAIDNSTEETTIVFGGNIDLGNLFSTSTLSTRAAATLPIVIPEGKVVTLDLNGFNLTTPWEDEAAQKHYYAFENHGSLTIQDSNGNGQIIARGIFNYGTMTLKSGTINACDGNRGYGVRNYEGAEFIMNGGSIITSYEDGDKPGVGYDASPVRVDEGATATINGGAINNVSNFTVAIDNYGTTTINDGTFTTIHTTIANSATMTINGGSFTCNGLEGVTAHALWAAEGTTTINGGTFNGKDNYNGFNVDADKGAIVNINGGKFLPVHSGSLYGEGTINVKGGEFFDQIAESRIDSDYMLVKNGEFYTLERKPDVAKIGEVGYTSLQKAVAAVQDGETITLVANETFTEKNYYDNGGWKDGLGYAGDKSFTIDLNSKTIGQNGALNDYLIWIKNDGSKANTITLKNGTLDAGTTAYCAFATSSSNKQKITINLENVNLVGNNSNGAVAKIRGGAELNVKAGTVITGNNNYVGIEAAGNNTVVNIYEGAEIYQNGTSSYVGAIVGASQNATMNINGGYGKSAKCGIIVMSTGATINVSGGEWIANNDGTVANDNNAVLVSQNNRYESSWACKSILNVTGGTFKGGYNCYGMGPGVEPNDAQINIKGGNFNADPASYLAEGCEATEANGVWNVRVIPVAKIGETEYDTLQEAFNVGGNITLLRNVTVAETVTLAEGKTAVFDLNGKTLSGTMHKNNGAVVKNEGTLTVKNGTVKSTANNGGSAIANYGTLTIDNATINGAPREGESWPSYPINNYSNATVTNSVVTGYQGCLALNNAGTTTINDCNFTKNYEKTSSHVFYVNHADAKVIINGGTYNHNGFDGSLAYINKGEVTINAGTFNAKDGGYGVAVLSGGKVTVNGGTLPAFLNWGGQIIDNRTK